jgi:hypothetical protein
MTSLEIVRRELPQLSPRELQQVAADIRALFPSLSDTVPPKPPKGTQ